MRIGIVGFSSQQFDQEKAKSILKIKIQRAISDTDKKEIEIVSGYTNTGISRISYEVANSLGLKTVGFSAKEALTVSSGLSCRQRNNLREEFWR